MPNNSSIGKVVTSADPLNHWLSTSKGTFTRPSSVKCSRALISILSRNLIGGESAESKR